MRICVVGPGRIGGNLARRFAQAGHDVVATFAGDAQAAEAALRPSGVAFVADSHSAIHGADVVVLSVPWGTIDDAWTFIGDVGNAVIVDTTNPFGPDGVVELPCTSAAFNARRFGLKPYVKAFNTLTAAFQAAAIDRPVRHRAAMFYVASDPHAAKVAEALIGAVGFVPVYVGGPAESEMMEAPRRTGAAYGEEYTPEGARAAVEAFHAQRPIPPPS